MNWKLAWDMEWVPGFCLGVHTQFLISIIRVSSTPSHIMFLRGRWGPGGMRMKGIYEVSSEGPTQSEPEGKGGSLEYTLNGGSP